MPTRTALRRRRIDPDAMICTSWRLHILSTLRAAHVLRIQHARADELHASRRLVAVHISAASQSGCNPNASMTVGSITFVRCSTCPDCVISDQSVALFTPNSQPFTGCVMEHKPLIAFFTQWRAERHATFLIGGAERQYPRGDGSPRNLRDTARVMQTNSQAAQEFHENGIVTPALSSPLRTQLV
jgi:hypothetical protein